MNRTIEIIIGTTGEIQIDAVGFKGADCEKATAFLEAGLGRGREKGQEAGISPAHDQGASTTTGSINAALRCNLTMKRPPGLKPVARWFEATTFLSGHFGPANGLPGSWAGPGAA